MWEVGYLQNPIKDIPIQESIWLVESLSVRTTFTDRAPQGFPGVNRKDFTVLVHRNPGMTVHLVQAVVFGLYTGILTVPCGGSWGFPWYKPLYRRGPDAMDLGCTQVSWWFHRPHGSIVKGSPGTTYTTGGWRKDARMPWISSFRKRPGLHTGILMVPYGSWWFPWCDL